MHAWAHARLLQLYQTLCNSIDCNPPGSSVHGISQARILGWVVLPSSRGSSQLRDWPLVSSSPAPAGRCSTTRTTWKSKWSSLSCVWLFETSTIQSMEFSRPEYWSGQPSPSPGDLPNPGIRPRSPVLWVDSLPAKPQGKSKNTWVGSSSLLQWIFPTQKLNQGLLHCRWILYQLNYQGSPTGKPQLQLKYSLSSQFRYKTSISIWELRSFQTQKSSTYSWTQLNFSNCILSLTLCPQDMWIFWLWMRKRLFPSHLNEAWACWLYHPQISQYGFTNFCSFICSMRSKMRWSLKSRKFQNFNLNSPFQGFPDDLTKSSLS